MAKCLNGKSRGPWGTLHKGSWKASYAPAIQVSLADSWGVS